MGKFLSIILMCLLAFPALAADKNPVDIREWEVPWPASRPRDPFVVTGDEIWFVGQRDHYLASFIPSSEAFSRVDLEDGAGPHNLIVGRDGTVWFAGNLKGYIGRHDPATGIIDKIAMPDAAARDPHTLTFDGDESHIWFTVQGGNFVGRLTISDKTVDLIPVPTKNARPYGIVMGTDGTPWVALFGTNKLARIDAGTLALSEHALPRGEARPRRLGVTSDGRVWYVDYAGGFVGAFNPATGAFTEWPVPSAGDAKPYAMTIDSQDRIWFVETGPSPNLFVGFDPGAQEFFSVTAIPSGAGSVRHMVYDAKNGTVWFGTDNNTIGRAEIE